MQNTTDTAVLWEVNGVAGGSSTFGVISSTGLYTAPPTIPSNPTLPITAVAQADTTKSATATVTIIPPAFSNASLKGAYVFEGGFLSAPTDTSVAGNPALAMAEGTFTADGQGRVTGMVDEVLQIEVNTPGQHLGQSFTGDYDVAADGTVSATLSLADGTVNQIQFALASMTMTQLDKRKVTGILAVQQPVAVFAGSFQFAVAGLYEECGMGEGPGSCGWIGVGAAGPISLANGSASGFFTTTGTIVNGTPQSLSGAYSVTGTRGTLDTNMPFTNGDLTYTIYVIDGNHFTMMSTALPTPPDNVGPVFVVGWAGPCSPTVPGCEP